MNYQAIYNSLIERGKNRTLEGYCEKHHIIPRCMGGNDNSENLVKLTAREHFIAHRLLTKIYPNVGKLKFAAFMMSYAKSAKRNFKISSRTYEYLKLALHTNHDGRKRPLEIIEKAKQTKAKNGTDKYEKICKSCHKKYFAGSSTGKFCRECVITPCKCGCGQMVVTHGKFYKNRHRPTKKKNKQTCTACGILHDCHSSKSKFCSECRKPKPCKCGCGQMVVYPGRYYKASHDKTKNSQHECTCQFCNIEFIAGSAVGKTCPECSKPRLCKCGCGAIIKKPGAYFRTKAHKVYFEDKFDK